MSLLFLFSLTLSLIISTPLMLQPITLGLNLLMLTLISAAIIAYACSAWLGYIVFIIYIGGVLVMFAYVAALTPNLMFSLKQPYLFFFPALVMFLTLSLFLNVKTPHTNLMSTTPPQMNEMTGTILFSSSNSLILIFLGLILLLALIAVVKICHFGSGPLRPFK